MWLKGQSGFKVLIGRYVVFNEFDFSCLTTHLPISEPAAAPNKVEHLLGPSHDSENVQNVPDVND